VRAKRFVGSLCGWMLVGVSASAACGGSVTNVPPADGGSDGGGSHDARSLTETTTADVVTTEASTGTDSSEAMTTQPYDGTTGKPCTTDADCKAPNGPGLARCSNSVYAPNAEYPTAVCIVPTCSPISMGGAIHYCDGPDDPSSPGVCVPVGTMGGGQCFPRCTYDTTGDAPKGCQGKDTCFAMSFVGSSAAGIGYCWGGCASDGDCPSGQKCQTDLGTCVSGVIPRTKSIGQACNQADANGGACDCLYGGTAEAGYCTSYCVVGGDATCPGGFVCGADELRVDGYSSQNPGMAGRCHVECSASDGGASDAGGCPTNSTCSDIYAAGPYCIVP
jgi:hypothetical protein